MGYGKRATPVVAKTLSAEELEQWRHRARTKLQVVPADDASAASPEPAPGVIVLCENDTSQRRGARRQKTLIGGRVVFEDMMMTAYSCTIRDLSESGARISLSAPVQMPPVFELRFSDGRIRRCEVRRRKGLELGIAFID